MSYQLSEIRIENYERLVTNANPLYIPLGALSPNDMTTLKVSVVVGSVSVGCSADLTLEESMDGGASWFAITTATDGPAIAAATYSVWITNDSGIPAPNIRLKVLPGAIDSLYITKVYRTFTTGDNIIPRTSLVSAGLATEATLLLVEGHVSTIDTNIGLIEGHISTIDTNVGTIDTNIGLIEGHISTIDTNVGAIDTKVGTIDTNVGLIEGHISTIDTNVGTIDTNVGLIEGHISTIDTNVGTIDTNVGLIEGHISTIDTNVGTIDTNVGLIEGHISTIDTNVGTIDTNVGLIEGHISTIDTNVGTIDTNISDVKTLITDKLSGSLVPLKFDYIAYTDGGASETYVYKTGGAGGTTQKTVTITYVDVSKAVLVSVAAT